MIEDEEKDLTIELDAFISAPEDRERLLAETMAHAEVRDAHYSQPMVVEEVDFPWRGPLGILLMAFAGWVFFVPPSWALGPPPPSIPSAELQRGLMASLYVQAQEIETFRFRQGRLPESLDELGFQAEGVEYIRSSNAVYQLVALGPNGRVIYDSARPGDEFTEAARWVPRP